MSLILTCVAALIVKYLVFGLAGRRKFPVTVSFEDNALFSPLMNYLGALEGTRLNTSLLLTLAAIPLTWVFMKLSFTGFQLRVAGDAPAAARYAGHSEKRAIWIALLISGAAAGLAGVTEVAGPIGELNDRLTPGYGYRHHTAALGACTRGHRDRARSWHCHIGGGCLWHEASRAISYVFQGLLLMGARLRVLCISLRGPLTPLIASGAVRSRPSTRRLALSPACRRLNGVEGRCWSARWRICHGSGRRGPHAPRRRDARGSHHGPAFAVLTLTLQANRSRRARSRSWHRRLGVRRGYVGFRAPATFEDLPIPGLSGPAGDRPLLLPARLRGDRDVRPDGVVPVPHPRGLRCARSAIPKCARLGLRVTRIRYAAVLFGGADTSRRLLLPVAQFRCGRRVSPPATAGSRSPWWCSRPRPWRTALCALLFGGVTGFGLYLQAAGVHVSPFLLGSLPYLATIAALVAVSASPQLLRRHAPASLGKPFFEGD